ncbi:MAG: S26 family signal peptidase [Candidatus Thermoplasmatota archaeon]|nr:S26 family signal peptidase [Candidatus Thermoplasmatota archaeon]
MQKTSTTREDRAPGQTSRGKGPRKDPDTNGRPPRDRVPKEDEGSKKEDLRTRIWNESRSFIFDFIGAMIVLLIIIGALHTYTGNWPPLVVVQSGSMEHSDESSSIGVIDTGDLVFVKKLGEGRGPVTYVEGVMSGHRTYDSYGDVIIFRPNGNETRTAIIHRAVVWIEFNSSTYNTETGQGGGYDVPSLGLRNIMDRFIIKDYEWPERSSGGIREINVATILYKFRMYGVVPHSGFLTKGDDNEDIDQTSSFGGSEPSWIQPVKREWIIGKSVGELPWFGIIKLKLEGNGGNKIHSNSERNLWIALVVIVASPFILDLGLHFLIKAVRSKEEDGEEKTNGKEGPPDGSRPRNGKSDDHDKKSGSKRTGGSKEGDRPAHVKKAPSGRRP